MATFTALNGASPKPAEGTNGAADSDRLSSQPASAEPRPAEVPDSQRDREGRDGREGQQSQSGTNHDRLPSSGGPQFGEPTVSHKRKRSISDSPRREPPLSPPTRAERTEPAERAERTEQYGRHAQYQSDLRQAHGSPQRDARRGGPADDGRESDEQRRAQQQREERTSSHEGPYSAGPVSAQSEEQAGEELLRRTSQGEGAGHGNQTPGGDERAAQPGQQHAPEQRKDGVVQPDPKKRKRNFSNRTKTGCMTCRKRKKKCDESKPECECATFDCMFFALVASAHGLLLRPHWACSDG